MKQEQIDKLNKGIRNIVEEFNCDWLTAMESIALAAQLTKAKVSDEGDACGECVRDSEANISQPEIGDTIKATWPGQGCAIFPIAYIRPDRDGVMCAVFGEGATVGAEAISDLVPDREGNWIVQEQRQPLLSAV